MTDNPQIAADQQRLRELTEAHIAATHAGDIAATKAHVAEGMAIIDRWAERGQAVDLLAGLLHDPSPSLRYAAAGNLLRLGEHEQALPVLEDLRDHDEGAAGLDAGLLLQHWRRQQAQP